MCGGGAVTLHAYFCCPPVSASRPSCSLLSPFVMSSYMDAASINRRTVLYIGGLDENVTEKTLEAAFLPFGDLVRILIPKDATTGKHRGFGFVDFEEADDAKQAEDNMDDSQMFGRVLRVKIAKPNAIQQQSVWAQQEAADEETQQSREQADKD